MITDNLTPLEVLQLTVIGEARGEPIESQVAVACVMRNRLHSNPSKYKNYRDVCLEKSQFSCWNSNDPNRGLLEDLSGKMLNNVEINDIYLRQCLYISEGVYNWVILDNTRGATYYLTRNLYYHDRPKWAVKDKNTTFFGAQVYFSL